MLLALYMYHSSIVSLAYHILFRFYYAIIGHFVKNTSLKCKNNFQIHALPFKIKHIVILRF